MKKLLFFIGLLLFVVMAVCSCRSTRQTQIQTASDCRNVASVRTLTDTAVCAFTAVEGVQTAETTHYEDTAAVTVERDSAGRPLRLLFVTSGTVQTRGNSRRGQTAASVFMQSEHSASAETTEAKTKLKNQTAANTIGTDSNSVILLFAAGLLLMLWLKKRK